MTALLTTPLRIGRATARNRIVFCAHLTSYATEGLPTAQHAAYYAARARGGAGLIITEEHVVHPTDQPYEKVIRGHDPRVLDGYRKITDAVHRHGALILASSITTARRAPDATREGRCGRRARSPTRCSGRYPFRSRNPRSLR